MRGLNALVHLMLVETSPDKVGDVFDQARLHACLTTMGLARLCCINHTLVEKLLEGKAKWTKPIIIRMAEVISDYSTPCHKQYKKKVQTRYRKEPLETTIISV